MSTATPVSSTATAPAGSPGKTRPRFAGVDGLRALAALFVVMTHVASQTGADTSTVGGYVLAHLDVGVSIFFVLSGFLLYRPWAAAHLDGRAGPSLGGYLRRRVLRIVPAYWIALTFFAVLGVIHFRGIGDAAAYYGLAQVYWRQRALGGIVAAWSLSVEMSFYLFLPIYAWVVGAVLSRLSGTSTARRPGDDPDRARRAVRIEVVGVVGLYAFGLGMHALLLATHRHATVATLWLPAQVDLFALGMGLAVASAWGHDHGSVPRLLAVLGRFPALSWLLAGAVFLIAATQLNLPRTFGDLPKGGEMDRQICYGLTAFGLVVPALFGPQDRGIIRRLLRNPAVEAIGLVSYGVFLWHFDWVVKLYSWGAGHWVPQLRFVSVLIVTLAVTLPCAVASYVLVERPFMRYQPRPWRAP
jgi:peptidoglycan/LPS O-acetylase OafA/YrhL